MTPYIRMRDARGSCFDELLVVVKAYFDDSGKLGNPGELAAVVGGLIATVDEWDKLEPEWFAVICRYKVKEFKAADLQNRLNDYRGWDEKKEQTFRQELHAVIDKYIRNPSKPLAACLPLSQWEQLDQAKKAEWGNDPFFVCLQHAITMSADHASRLEYDAVEIFCDEEERFHDMAEIVYKACKKHLGPSLGGLLTQYSMIDSKKYAGIQVADLIAYEARKLRRAMIEEKEGLIDRPRWPLEQLFKLNVDFEYYTFPTLEQLTPLVNYTMACNSRSL